MKPSQLKETLRIAIKNHFPILIVGPPGIGKTDIGNQVCQELDTDLIVTHPVVSDPTDYKGLPFLINDNGEQTAEFLPFGDLNKIIKATKPTVFFIDDLGQAPVSVQAAVMQLLLGRRINGHKVSDQVTFIAATNRRIDQAGVQGILEPVKSRFTAIVNLEVDLDDWIEWALNNDMPIELISFIRFRPELLHDFKPSKDMVNSPSPRTVAQAGRLFNANIPKELEYEIFTGAAGEAFAAEFLGFLGIYRSLPNIDLLLMSPETIDLPHEPSVLYATCAALVNKCSDQNFNRIVIFANRLAEEKFLGNPPQSAPEFSVMLVRDCLQKDKALVNTKTFINWSIKHSNVLI